MAETKEDLVELIDSIYEETSKWQYLLIGSLNYPEIDQNVRIMRQGLMNFEDSLARIKREINRKLINRDRKVEEQ